MTQTVEIELSGIAARLATRIAREQGWSVPEAVTYLVSRGVEAQQAREASVDSAYGAVVTSSPETEEKAGKDLIRAVFGDDSVA